MMIAATLPLASLCILLLAVYKLIVYPFFLSPLAHVPAANSLARVSSLWILWKRFRKHENAAIFNAHHQKGEVVLLAPNELSVNCVDNGIRTVYVGGFEKHEFYSNLFSNFDGVHNMFSTVRSKPHSSRKRMVTNVYSKSYIQTSPTADAIGRRLIYERLLPKLASFAESGANVEVHQLWGSATMDFVTAYKFGLRSSSNFLQDDERASWWMHHYNRRKKYIFYPAELPGLTSFLLNMGIGIIPRTMMDSTELLEAWTLKMCDSTKEAESHANLDQEQDYPENAPIVYRQLKASLASPPAKSTYIPIENTKDDRLALASELLDNLAAGHETSATTMLYLFWELNHALPLNKKLRDEVLTLEPQINLARMRQAIRTGSLADEVLPSAKSLDALPLLHAVIMETLRLHAAIPGPQPRVTPSGGTKLGKYAGIPGGVRVSASAYHLHRNPNVYPDPDKFDPYRWLPNEDLNAVEDEARRAEMLRWFWAFGSGGRMCIGSNLAMWQMKLVVAAVVSCFKVVLVDDTGIEHEDGYTAQPVGGKCIMRFEEW